ncbi:MAG: hypothetical protein K0Q73_8616 [Paenibacillus sp.]|jgi:hypothetical protein|nr:hypothetical protein [Paenibacillus sp.]
MGVTRLRLIRWPALLNLMTLFSERPRKVGNAGHGTEQTPVLGALSLDKKGCPKYLKMLEIPDVKSTMLVDFAQKHIEAGSTISSDKYRSYSSFGEQGYEHKGKLFNPVENPNRLKLLHTVISNAKAFMAIRFTVLIRSICKRIWMSSAIGSIVAK